MTVAEKVQVLCGEYQACITDACQLDNDIWQSATIFFGVSFLGFGVLFQMQAEDIFEFATHIVIALVGITLIILWRRLCSGWLRLLHINFYRMREIEEDLGMWKERYIHFFDPPNGIPEHHDTETEKRLQTLQALFAQGDKLKGPTGVSRLLKSVSYLIIGCWIALIVKQAIFLIWSFGQ